MADPAPTPIPPAAPAELLPLVYDELRALATGHLAGEPAGHTLPPTALVHETYLKLAARPDFPGRSDFLAAGEAMRRLLIARPGGRVRFHGPDLIAESVQIPYPAGATYLLALGADRAWDWDAGFVRCVIGKTTTRWMADWTPSGGLFGVPTLDWLSPTPVQLEVVGVDRKRALTGRPSTPRRRPVPIKRNPLAAAGRRETRPVGCPDAARGGAGVRARRPAARPGGRRRAGGRDRRSGAADRD